MPQSDVGELTSRVGKRKRCQKNEKQLTEEEKDVKNLYNFSVKKRSNTFSVKKKKIRPLSTKKETTQPEEECQKGGRGVGLAGFRLLDFRVFVVILFCCLFLGCAFLSYRTVSLGTETVRCCRHCETVHRSVNCNEPFSTVLLSFTLFINHVH